MKKIIITIIIILTAISVLALLLSLFFNDIIPANEPIEDTNIYRNRMREWVITISQIAKNENENFIIIPQNCSPLFTDTGTPYGKPSSKFLQSIDAIGQEGLTCGDPKYNVFRDIDDLQYLTSQLNIASSLGIVVFAMDYCDREEYVTFSKSYCAENRFVSFQAANIDLNKIPQLKPNNENNNDIISLSQAKNCLFLLNPENFDTKQEYINALKNTNYDVLIIDAFYADDIMLSAKDVQTLSKKPCGSNRLVIAYLSIGEAEDYRYYWKEEYFDSPPTWIVNENKNWAGNYPVMYWEKEWQSIIATSEDSYLSRIISSNFNGVYLDIVDGYETFE